MIRFEWQYLNRFWCVWTIFYFWRNHISMEITKTYSPGQLIAGQFAVQKILGKGGYGMVYACIDQDTGDAVAVKQSQMAENEGLSSYAIREIALLKKINNENVVKFKGYRYENPFLFLIFELLETDLLKLTWKHKGNPLPPESIKVIVFQILKGVEVCHKNRVIHRDIKPANIFIGTDNSIKIGDFGMARPLNNNQPKTEGVVTLCYRAPQILKGMHYDMPADIWSVGCIFAELVLGTLMFPGNSEQDQLSIIERTMGVPPENQWPEYYKKCNCVIQPEESENEGKMVDEKEEQIDSFQDLMEECKELSDAGKDLLRKMLTMNPASRITMSECLQHNYFK